MIQKDYDQIIARLDNLETSIQMLDKQTKECLKLDFTDAFVCFKFD